MAEGSLREFHIKDLGVEKNLATAAAWFRKSAAHGWGPSGEWAERIEAGKVE